MHSSFFNYSITRPYPYKWFTPVAIVGILALAVLLSVLNFVQNSYTLIVQYSNDPNSTIREGIWFNHWPSYLTSSVRPACEPANLPLNTQFFTNQSGLTWTLTSVFSGQHNSAISPALTYMNNPFEDDCTVAEVQINFDGTQDRQVAVSASTPWDVQVRAFVTCSVWSPQGYNHLNLTAMYDAIQPYTVAGSSIFVATNAQSRASMYWSEALLSAYLVDTANRLDEVSLNLHPTIVNGYANLYPTNTATDIRDLAFFDVAFDFLFPTENTGFGWHGPLHSIDTYIKGTNVDFAPQPQIWLQVDGLAKSMYSAVLADLGQTRKSSLVTNPTTLQYFTSNFSAIDVGSILYYKQLETQDYDSRQQSSDPTGPLGLTPSVISTNYLCQVPQRKPIGDIFISVLLADLVLLSAAWKLYSLIVKSILMRRHDTARHCEGCLIENEQSDEETGKITRVFDGRLKSGDIISTKALPRADRKATASNRPRWKTALSCLRI